MEAAIAGVAYGFFGAIGACLGVWLVFIILAFLYVRYC